MLSHLSLRRAKRRKGNKGVPRESDNIEIGTFAEVSVSGGALELELNDTSTTEAGASPVKTLCCSMVCIPHGPSGHKKVAPQLDSKLTFETTTCYEPFGSARFANLINYGIAAGELLSVHYCSFDVKRKRVYRRKFKHGNIGWALGTVAISFYVTFLLVQLFPLIKRRSLDTDTVNLGFAIFLFVLPVTFQATSKFYCDELIEITNQTICFFKGFVKHFKHLEHTKTTELKICEAFLLLVYFSLPCIGILLVAVSLFRPYSKPFLSSWCIDPADMCHSPMRVISLVVLTYTTYVCLAGATIYCCGICIVIQIRSALKHIRKIPISWPDTTEVLSLYKQIQILVDMLNSTGSTLIIPAAENILMTLSVFGIYGALRLHGLLKVTIPCIAFWSFCLLMLLFWMLAQVHGLSSALLAEWMRDPRFRRRDLRALRPLRVKLGGYAFVDARITLTIIDVIVSYSITLLLMA